MDPVLLVGRTAQVLSTQREEGHTKAPLREGRVHTDHLTNCLQHLPILTSSRSIISEKNDPIYLKSLKKKKKKPTLYIFLVSTSVMSMGSFDVFF